MIKNIIFLIIFFTFSQNISFADKNLNKLKLLYEEGILTESEFKKAIKLLDSQSLEIDHSKIKIIKTNESYKDFEKMEFSFDNYRAHILRPGLVRIDNLKTGITDVELKGTFKYKISKQGKNFFEIIKQEDDDTNLKLNYRGKTLMSWDKRYVKRYNANFLQMQVFGYKPFHFYIKIPGKQIIALNVDRFKAKIDKAVDKVKQEFAIKYNLSVGEIDRILQNKKKEVDNEINKVIQDLTEKYAGEEINEQIRKEIERTVGQEMADAFIAAIEDLTGSAIDDAIEAEIAAEIDAAIQYAIELGVSQAAAEAAIAAMLIVYALGGSDQDALDACREIAGDAC